MYNNFINKQIHTQQLRSGFWKLSFAAVLNVHAIFQRTRKLFHCLQKSNRKKIENHVHEKRKALYWHTGMVVPYTQTETYIIQPSNLIPTHIFHYHFACVRFLYAGLFFYLQPKIHSLINIGLLVGLIYFSFFLFCSQLMMDTEWSDMVQKSSVHSIDFYFSFVRLSRNSFLV